MKMEEKGECVAVDPAVNSITRTAIGCAYTANNSLGCGFLEKVYVFICGKENEQPS